MLTTAPGYDVFVDPPAPGAANMERDVALLDACAAGTIAGVVRLYSFSPPCLSLGRLQPGADVDVTACERDGVDVVRRPSGGRAVLHDDEVTYAVVCRTSDPVFGGNVLESCRLIHAAVAAGVARLGVETAEQCLSPDERAAARERWRIADCFARPAAHELIDKLGRKLVGSAQARRRGALLQHGSVLLGPPRAAMYLHDAAQRPSRGGVRELLGRHVTREELGMALLEGFVTSISSRSCAVNHVRPTC